MRSRAVRLFYTTLNNLDLALSLEKIIAEKFDALNKSPRYFECVTRIFGLLREMSNENARQQFVKQGLNEDHQIFLSSLFDLIATT